MLVLRDSELVEYDSKNIEIILPSSESVQNKYKIVLANEITPYV